MSINALILIVCSVSISLLGSLVLMRNPRSAENQRFAFSAFSLLCWTISNFLSDNVDSNILFFTRLTIFWGVASILSLISFVAIFPNYKIIKNNMYLSWHKILSVILMFFSFSPWLIVSVSKEGGGEIETSFLYYLFIIYVGFSLLLFFDIIRLQNKSAISLAQRQQIKFISLGITLWAVLATLFNVLIPLLFSNWSTSRFGPVFVLLIVGLVAFTIIKHKLFDIRLVIARSLGYILTLATLVSIYVLLIFGFSTNLLGVAKLTISQEVLYILATLVFGFSLVPLKRFFDKLTNKLFYRDAYESQELLDELNKILVGNIDIQPLLRQCAELFETTLKSEFCTFIIKETDDTVRRVIGSKKVNLDEAQILELSSQNHMIDQIIVADELEESQTTLKTMLSKNNVAILARLAPAGRNAIVQGYLVLGAKRSGNPYNKQDLQVLDIIANELVIAIQNALRFEEIEAFTVTLQEKVNEATRQLRRTNEKLKALDETKDEFISMASHQLRTPLTAVKGYVSMVVEGDAGKLNKQQKELLDQAFASSQHMVYLIADLLNVSRLKTGKFVIENKATNLADVIEAEIEQLKQVAAGKQQTLTYTKPAKFPELMLDDTKIRQVIMNFTDNALHYTPNGGHIDVRLEDKGQSVEFTVVDDGLGVPKAEQHHLFGKFFRAGNAKKARPDGTGLGLFMAKKVIIAQGGAVIFSSTEGKGSTFGFTMPKELLKVKS
jgi:signal transduction histidine kinase